MIDNPLFYFLQASALTHEDKRLFIKYCECNEIGTDEASLDFCRYVVGFNFKKIDRALNGYIEMAKLALSNRTAFAFPLPMGCYVKNDYTHVINMTALGESLLAIKQIYNLRTENIHIIHDRIPEFEEEYYDSFGRLNVVLDFADSRNEILLQYADNVASVFRKCCTETIKLFLSNNQWDIDKQWFPSIYAKLLKKLSYRRIKWDMAISDQVLPLCIAEMFDDAFPVAQRNNTYFKRRFMEYKRVIMENIASLNYDANL